MSKPLEMTEEQETALANLLLACGSTRGCEASDAERVWAHVRDQVLEAAAKACESLATVDGQVIPGLRNELDCAEAVRAMKGSP